MTANATARVPDPTYIAGDDAAHKIVVLRLLLERLADDLGKLEMFAEGDNIDPAELRERLGEVTMLAYVALEEVAPLESRP